jgi:tetratricopeptide (TPR) repeat protein
MGYLNEILEIDSHNAKAIRCLAERAVKMKDMRSALKIYSDLNASSHDNLPITQIREAELLLHAGQLDKSINLLKKILVENPDNVLAHAALANILLKMRLFTQAEEHAQAINKRIKNSIDGHTLSVTALIGQGKIQDALNDCSRMLQVYPGNLNFLLLEAAAWSENNDRVKAVAAYRSAAQQNPQSTLPWYNLANLYLQDKDYQAAIDCYQSILLISPDEPIAMNNLIMLYLETGTQLDRALEMSSALISRLPDSPSILDTYGWVLYHHGEYHKAIEFFLQSLRADPNNPTTCFHLGQCQVKLGEVDAACQSLNRVMKMARPTQLVDLEKCRRLMIEINCNAVSQ